MNYNHLWRKLAQGLDRTRVNLLSRLGELLGTAAALDEDLLEELEAVMVQADLGVATTTLILDRLREKMRSNGPVDRNQVISSLREALLSAFAPQEHRRSLDLSGSPSVILVVGVNGTGKTTSVAKLAHFLQGHGRRVLLAAADTFRAAAAEQLEAWGSRTGCDVVRQAPGADPAAVAFDAVQASRARGAQVVLVDTAGRLHTKKNLMDELAKMNRVIAREAPGAPHETLLTVDATTGGNALQQARVFSRSVDLSGLILTKLDGTARGGIVVAIERELQLPVKFVGLGEALDDLQPFRAEVFVDALLHGR